MTAEWVFWIAALLLAYAYAGYPMLASALAALRPRPARARPIEPAVSVVVAARDEEERIGARVRDLLALDYPRDRLEILIGSDGSRDRTASAARAAAGTDGASAARGAVRVVAFARRRGKAAVLNDLVAAARGEIVVLTDARQRFETGALRALVAPFADREVGVVSGELVLTRGALGPESREDVGAYWRYEKRLRAAESRFASCVGATGAIYALRRVLYEPIPEDTILDDLLIPMRVARRGWRVWFEPKARAVDAVAATPSEEFRRKTRTLAGNVQLFRRERWLLDPRRNPLFWQTVSHKGLRLLGPVLLVAAAAASAALRHRPPYGALAILQGAFYAAALAGTVLPGRGRWPAVLRLPALFAMLNAAVVVGAVRYLRGRQPAAWEPAAAKRRSAPGSP